MLCLIRNMRAFSAEATGSPVIGFVHIKGVLRRCGMRPCVLMLVFDVRFDIAVANTSVIAVTSLGFKAKLTASFTQQAKAFGTIVCQLVAGAAQTAAILIPVVMVAKPAFNTVFPCRHDRSR